MEFIKAIITLVGSVTGIYLVITGLIPKIQISKLIKAISKGKVSFDMNNINSDIQQQMMETSSRMNQQTFDDSVRTYNQIQHQAHDDAMSMHNSAVETHNNFDFSVFNDFTNMT